MSCWKDAGGAEAGAEAAAVEGAVEGAAGGSGSEAAVSIENTAGDAFVV